MTHLWKAPETASRFAHRNFRTMRKNYCTGRPAPLSLRYKYPSSFPKAFFKLQEYTDSVKSLDDATLPPFKKYDRLTNSMGYVGDEDIFFDALCDAVKNSAYERVFHYLDTAEKEGIQPLPFRVMKAVEELFTELATGDVQSATDALPNATKIVVPLWMSVMRLQLGPEFLNDQKTSNNTGTHKALLPEGRPPFAFSLEAPALPLLWFYDDGEAASRGKHAARSPALRNLPDPSILYRLSVSALSTASSLGDAGGISLIASTIFRSTADCSTFGEGAKLTARDIAHIWDDVLTFIAEGFRRCSSTHFTRFAACAERVTDSPTIVTFPPRFGGGDSWKDSKDRQRVERSVQYFPNAMITLLEGLNVQKGTPPAIPDFDAVLKLTVSQVVEKKVHTDVSDDGLYLLRDLVCEHSAVGSEFLKAPEPLLVFLQRPRADFYSLFDAFEKTSIESSFRQLMQEKSLRIREDTLDRPLSWVIERALVTLGNECVFHQLRNLLHDSTDLNALPFLFQDPSLFPLTWEALLHAIIRSETHDTETLVHVLSKYIGRVSEPACVQRVTDDGLLAGATFDALVKLKLVTLAAAYLASTLRISNLHISASSFQTLYRIARDEGMSTLCAALQPKRTLIAPQRFEFCK